MNTLNYNYNDSLQTWHQILKEEPDARKRSERMFKEGVREVGKGLLSFDTVLTCEALGEAEIAGAIDLQAEAYKRIGMLWGKDYPALSLSIWRKAEKFYQESGQSKDLDLLRLNLSLSCFLAGEKYEVIDKKLAKQFRDEAGRIIQTVNEPQDDALSVASFRYTKGTILRDDSLVKQARAFYEHEGLWSGAIQCLDEEIRMLLDSGKNYEALPLMKLVKEYAVKDGDMHFANIVAENITHVDQLESGPRIKPMDADNLNVLDILDILAYHEERVIFSDIYKANKVTTGYEPQEGRFIVLRDGRLMPTFRESWRLYRGESEFHTECKPTLWRIDMNDKLRFVERMKFVEFEQALKKLPEYKCFCSGFNICDPDGLVYHVTPNIDTLGMAQHYGIKTEMMDVTADKWVAAFFACTKHNNNDDTYSPILEKTTKQGVIYNMPVRVEDINKISVVGAQPFERPTAQAAFMVKMKPNDNFNNLSVKHTFFKQSPIVSLIVYHYVNRCNRLFPAELIQKKTWDLIKQDNPVFSIETMQKARDQFKDDMDDSQFWDIQKDSINGVAVVNMPISEEEQKITADHWCRHEDLISRIDTYWFKTFDFKKQS